MSSTQVCMFCRYKRIHSRTDEHRPCCGGTEGLPVGTTEAGREAAAAARPLPPRARPISRRLPLR